MISTAGGAAGPRRAGVAVAGVAVASLLGLCRLFAAAAAPSSAKARRGDGGPDAAGGVGGSSVSTAAGADGADARPVGVMAPTSVPYLINLAHDPFSRHCLVYYVHGGETVVTTFPPGCSAEVPAISESPSIFLQDPSIRENHCTFVTDVDRASSSATVRLVPGPAADAVVAVNGVPA